MPEIKQKAKRKHLPIKSPRNEFEGKVMNISQISLHFSSSATDCFPVFSCNIKGPVCALWQADICIRKRHAR